jgi:serine/threonine-protein kinase
MLVKHISERPIPVEQRRTDVPTDLARAVMMLLEKEPANRFPSASALVTALDSGVVPTPRSSGTKPQVDTGGARGTASAADYGRQDMASRASGFAARPSGQGATHDPGYNFPHPPYPLQGREPGDASRPLAGGHTVDELRRWENPHVVAFRKKVAPYLFVNGVILLFSVFGRNGFFPITVLWSIIIAFQYAKLWSEGYDWRDVFRQPRDRELMEVVEEFFEYVRAMFNPISRARLREQRAERRALARMGAPALPSGMDASPPASYAAASLGGPSGDRARQAVSDRDEVIRRLNALPKAERERFSDVARSASALADRVGALALSLEELSRHDVAASREVLEREIQTLENAANPLERGSEDRVRRLAYLKRQRRALVDAEKKRHVVAEKLETCALALQSMRYDMMRLSASPQMHQHITSLANKALSLAENVDEAVFVADEMGRVGSARTSGARRAT